jgi:hypothetical protein
MERRAVRGLTDDELLRRLLALLHQSRRTEADIVAHVAEVDERKLYAREASPSMFAYCTEVLHLSEAEAYLRITAARASREHPLLLEMLADGRLHLSGISKLAPHITRENAAMLLVRAAHKSKRQIQELIAEITPRPDAPTAVRKLPESLNPTTPRMVPARLLDAVPPSRIGSREHDAPLGSEPRGPAQEGAEAERPHLRATAETELRPDAVAPSREARAKLEPLSPGRYRVQFTATATFKDKLERLQALMSSPDDDLVAVLEAAVTEKLERLEAKRFARTSAPRKRLPETKTAPTTRHIPAAVRRAVQERDGNRCRFVDRQGRRCSEQRRLEFHHRYPFGRGGDHSPPNVVLLCRAHNTLMAEQDYGRQALERNRAYRAAPRPPVVNTRPV